MNKAFLKIIGEKPYLACLLGAANPTFTIQC